MAGSNPTISCSHDRTKAPLISLVIAQVHILCEIDPPGKGATVLHHVKLQSKDCKKLLSKENSVKFECAVGGNYSKVVMCVEQTAKELGSATAEPIGAPVD